MNSKIKKILTLAVLAILPAALFGLSVNVERMSNEDGLPWGYADGTGLRDESETYSPEAFAINVSAAPFVDYMVAMNTGAAGILAEKVDGPFLSAEQSTVAQLSGGANGGFAPDALPTGTERFSLILEWEDGTPFPATDGWFGVSWGGWSNTDIEEMEVRVNLAEDGPVNVVHWFNDGWLYSTDVDGTEGNAHTILEGHEFHVTHYAADGSVIAEVEEILPSGGAGNALGKTGDFLIFARDHRQFYTASVTATRTGEGDYLMLRHRAGNIGYRATAVTLGNDRPWAPGFALVIGEWINDATVGQVFGYSPQWGYSTALGSIYARLMPEAVWAESLGWLFAPHGSVDSGLFLYRTETSSWIWIHGGQPGFYFDFASGQWTGLY